MGIPTARATVSLSITIDARHPARLARFWAEALPGYAVRPYDQAEIARLADLGLTPETDPSVAVDGTGPTLWFQQVDTVPLARNRLHFDLAFGERGSEVERLRALGAVIHAEHVDHTVMHDPEGNQFCVFEV